MDGGGDDDRKPAAKVAGEEGKASVSGECHAPKPALKKEDGTSNHKEKKLLKWDEPTIEEHDLLRGTRMKIDEPNTPYTHYDSGAESDGSGARPKSPAHQKDSISWDVLQTKLDSVKAARDAYPSSPSAGGDDSDACDDDEEKKRKELRRLEFKEHRKRHYNEMELVKQFRAEHPEGAYDDADDADDEA